MLEIVLRLLFVLCWRAVKHFSAAKFPLIQSSFDCLIERMAVATADFST
jgi:hypothetical protein